MRNPIAIRLVNVSKMYKIFSSRADNFIDALGGARVFRWRRPRFKEFWALRGVNLEVRAGSRVGILGRNGAGKTTLLKLITGNIEPTEGEVKVGGRVQALLEAGSGFHPEFTGIENVRAALTYQGLRSGELKHAIDDIVEFCEMEDFISQPFKTYSAGMQARLIFATATSINPEILIIDEILGAGDAYFLNKSAERMQGLVQSGATILIVSHDMGQIIRLCEDAVWLDRGTVVKRGSALEVVKSYEAHIRRLENERLKAKNRKMVSRRYAKLLQESYCHALIVRCVISPLASCDVSELVLRRDGEVDARVQVGGAQDGDSSHAAFVSLGDGDWSPPRSHDERTWRSLIGTSPHGGSGDIVFNLYYFFHDEDYAIDITYRICGGGALSLQVFMDGVEHGRFDLAETNEEWQAETVLLKTSAKCVSESVAAPETSNINVSRWPGEGSLMICKAILSSSDGAERAVFEVGRPLTLSVSIVAKAQGTYEVIPAATLYRIDGVLVTNLPGPSVTLSFVKDETKILSLKLGSLNLGNGNYVFSIAIFRKLSEVEPSEVYDLLDRSYEFRVVGNQPFHNGIFLHEGQWSLVAPTRSSMEGGH